MILFDLRDAGGLEKWFGARGEAKSDTQVFPRITFEELYPAHFHDVTYDHYYFVKNTAEAHKESSTKYKSNLQKTEEQELRAMPN